MTHSPALPKKAIILFDSRTPGGSTEQLIDSVGRKLAEKGIEVEKAKCKSTGDYSFVKEFDLVVMGAPIYYLLVSSELLGALLQSNLKESMSGKRVALFLACGSPELMANILYLPQLKLNLAGSTVIAEKIFAPDQLLDQAVISKYVDDLLEAFAKG
ncbi:MAG: flavodoxin domain-containing protein [Chlorobiaceae bacterium]